MKRTLAIVLSFAILVGVGTVASVIAFSVPAAQASDSP